MNAFLAQGGTLPPKIPLLHTKPDPSWTPADSLVWGRYHGAAALLELEWGKSSISTLKQTIPPDLFKLLRFSRRSPLQDCRCRGSGGERSLEQLGRWTVEETRAGAAMPVPTIISASAAPSIWYLVHIVTPQDAMGRRHAAPAYPLIVIGANDRVAWGLTTTAGDTEDLFEEGSAGRSETLPDLLRH